MKNFALEVQKNFDKMCETGKLFKSSFSGHTLWEVYLNSFSQENNPVFRDPSTGIKNCNSCNSFIKRYGNIVAIKNDKVITLFDGIKSEEYVQSAKAMSKELKKAPIQGVFVETFNMLSKIGYESKLSKNQENYLLGYPQNKKIYTKADAEDHGGGVVKEGEIRTFDHIHMKISKSFIDFTGNSAEQIKGIFQDKYSVFKRAIEELNLDTLNLVKDLINQGSLLDGTTHLFAIEAMIKHFKDFENFKGDPELFFWSVSSNLEERVAKFKNTLIGVLCTELAEGMELNKACENWNKRVDPVNYMKAVAPITEAQKKLAQKFIEENGYEDSFNRRLAIIDDIKASDILHLNSGSGTIAKVSMFDNIKTTSSRHKRSEFDKIEEVGIEKFMKDILPSCTSVEAFLENRLENNLVSLTTSNVKDSKPIFKWNNNFSWTFNGNIAGKSQIKENVKSVGGKTSGIFRCSLQWNDSDTPGIIDHDLHVNTPQGEIYFGCKRIGDGWLDVDMRSPRTVGIENITWDSKMPDGVYHFYVNNFSGHTKHKGFKAEIEFNGQTFTYQYLKSFTGHISIAKVTVKKGEIFIEHLLDSNESSREIYGLETNNFHKVNLVCYSPNHWENNVGNLHYFFMLDKCKSPVSLRSFHNENLISELLNHRKVLDVLGNVTMVESVDKQLSGLGFNSTVKDELILRLKGNFNRVIKLKF